MERQQLNLQEFQSLLLEGFQGEMTCGRPMNSVSTYSLQAVKAVHEYALLPLLRQHLLLLRFGQEHRKEHSGFLFVVSAVSAQY
jgi:hypothetical protein